MPFDLSQSKSAIPGQLSVQGAGRRRQILYSALKRRAGSNASRDYSAGLTNNSKFERHPRGCLLIWENLQIGMIWLKASG
ncbi:MAG: hypothetical protein WC449_03765 [Candidatus Paceibacterota bacterium]